MEKRYKAQIVCYGNYRSKILEAGTNTSGRLDSGIEISSAGMPAIVKPGERITLPNGIERYPDIGEYLQETGMKQRASISDLSRQDLVLTADEYLRRTLTSRLPTDTQVSTVLQFLSQEDPEVRRVIHTRAQLKPLEESDLDDSRSPASEEATKITGLGGRHTNRFYPVFRPSISVREREEIERVELEELIRLSGILPRALNEYFARR